MASLTVAITDPTKIAASANAGGPNHDGGIALKLAELAGKGPDLEYRKLIVGLGVESQTAQRRAEIQQSITDRIDAYRDADSGVNLDEEMTNMVAYQQAYNAAARFLTSVDEMIDTLINRTGLVGR
jgi:flagellar hook-associated protein 1 FlgK